MEKEEDSGSIFGSLMGKKKKPEEEEEIKESGGLASVMKKYFPRDF